MATDSPDAGGDAAKLAERVREAVNEAGTDRGKWVSILEIIKHPDFPGPFVDALCSGDFILASNLMTYNWVEGNDDAEWGGKPFEWYPVGRSADGHHYGHWYETIRANPLNMVLAARKHTKTTFAICLMAWKSQYVDGHQSLYWANTEGQVEERMEEFEEVVEANPWMDNLIDKRDECMGALKRKRFDNGSRVLTTWVEGAFEGGHVDLMIGDDPMKEFKDIADEQIAKWYRRVIVPVINVDGLMAIIGTRKRPTDLYELLRTLHESDDIPSDMPTYTLTEYPAVREAWQAEYDRPGDLAPSHLYTAVTDTEFADWLELGEDTMQMLWPAARPPKWILMNAGGQGRSAFLREFCMIFKQAEDAFIQRRWIDNRTANHNPPTDLSDAWKPMDYPEAVERPAFDEVVVGHDPAGKGRDRFGFVTVGTLTHPHAALPESMRRVAIDDEGEPVDVQIRHVLDVWQAQDVPPSRWREKLTALHDRYAPDAIAIESNLNQTWTTDDEAIPTRVRNVIEPVATTGRKHSWEDGVPAIGNDIEAGRYRFYAGADDLVVALTSLRYDEGRLVGHTPDLVMALYMAHEVLTDPGGQMAVSRASLTGGKRDPEREAEERERKESLRGSAVGEAILETAKRRRGGYYGR